MPRQTFSKDFHCHRFAMYPDTTTNGWFLQSPEESRYAVNSTISLAPGFWLLTKTDDAKRSIGYGIRRIAFKKPTSAHELIFVSSPSPSVHGQPCERFLGAAQELASPFEPFRSFALQPCPAPPREDSFS